MRWNSRKVKVNPHQGEESANRPQAPPSKPFGKVKTLFSKGLFNLTGLKTARRLSLPDALMEDGTKRWKLNAAYPLTDKLCYCCIPNQYAKAKLQAPEAGFFCVSTKFPGQYFPFGKDFGPTCISVIFRFCEFLKEKLKSGKGVIFCMNEEVRMRTNAAFLLASYLVLIENMTPEEAVEGFQGFNVEPFRDFCDVLGSTEPGHELSILASLKGLHRALKCGLFDLNKFDVARYEYYDDPINGDLHWPCSKLLAFKGPVSESRTEGKDGSTLTPEFYADIFERNGVSAVVRLNEPETYPAAGFTERGIAHHDLFFEDCSAPSMTIVKQFLDICEQEQGSVAVHCRAGLGRTGTLVAAWLMYKHGFTALEAVGWIRLVRPGSIIGRQQVFLGQLEQRMEEMTGGGVFGGAIWDEVYDAPFGAPALNGSEQGDIEQRGSLSLLQPLSAPGTLTSEMLATLREQIEIETREEQRDVLIS